jgi:hypothetical protein
MSEGPALRSPPPLTTSATFGRALLLRRGIPAGYLPIGARWASVRPFDLMADRLVGWADGIVDRADREAIHPAHVHC